MHWSKHTKHSKWRQKLFCRLCPTALPLFKKIATGVNVYIWTCVTGQVSIMNRKKNTFVTNRREKVGLHMFNTNLMYVPRALKCVIWPRPMTWIFITICIFIIGATGKNDDVAMTFGVPEGVSNVAGEALIHDQMHVVRGAQLQVFLELTYRVFLRFICL